MVKTATLAAPPTETVAFPLLARATVVFPATRLAMMPLDICPQITLLPSKSWKHQ